jgi:hypothetical protein
MHLDFARIAASTRAGKQPCIVSQAKRVASDRNVATIADRSRFDAAESPTGGIVAAHTIKHNSIPRPNSDVSGSAASKGAGSQLRPIR